VVGLAAAAVIACYVTTVLFSLFSHSMDPSPNGGWLDVFMSVVATWGPLSVVYGFIGACLFLYPAFCLARRTGRAAPIYALAGASAGIVHTVVGTLASPVPNPDWAGVFLLVGGFWLIPEFGVGTILVSTASAIAGAMAGAAYWWLAKPDLAS
jgi:hypothetical protein